MAYGETVRHIPLSIANVKYLMDLLQPEVGKDAGALELIRRFEHYFSDAEPSRMNDWERQWWRTMFPETLAAE